MLTRSIWLSLQTAGPFPGCPYNKSPMNLGSDQGPDFWNLPSMPELSITQPHQAAGTRGL